MTQSNYHTIRLLNKSYEIKCPENEADNLHAAALKLNASMLDKQQKFKELDTNQILLLAALEVSRELVTCETQQAERRQQLTQLIQSLEHKITEAAEEMP